MLSSTELTIVVMVIMLLFGSSQIPKLAKNLGVAQRELKNALAESEQELTPPASADPESAKTPAEI